MTAPARSSAITLQIPDEFADECAQYGMTVEQALHGFMADVAAIRRDPWSTHGSDERLYAERYMERVSVAYGGPP